MGSSPRDGLYLTVEDGVPQGEACEDGVCHAAPADRSTVGEKRHCSVTGGHPPWTRDSTRPRVLRRDPEAELKLSGCSDALFPEISVHYLFPKPDGTAWRSKENLADGLRNRVVHKFPRWSPNLPRYWGINACLIGTGSTPTGSPSGPSTQASTGSRFTTRRGRGRWRRPTGIDGCSGRFRSIVWKFVSMRSPWSRLETREQPIDARTPEIQADQVARVPIGSRPRRARPGRRWPRRRW
jgi:hypothetical protein